MANSSKAWLWALVFMGAMTAALVLPKLIDSGSAAELAGEEPAVGEPERLLRVDTLLLEPRTLAETLSTTGSIRAEEQVELRSEIAGIIERIHFAEGARVRSGDILVEIEDDELVAERDRARYRFELAKLREERQQRLLTDGLTSQDDYDVALNELNVLAAELKLSEVELRKSVIRAPFSGVVGFRSVSVGSAVSQQSRIATLQEIATVKVEFSVPERYSTRLAPGGSIGFRVQSDGRLFSGTIYAVEPTVDPETRSLRVRARSDNADGVLLPGAFADVELRLSEIVDALTIPSIAVIPELGGKKVFVYEDGRAAERLVETGIRTESEVQVTSGLAPGDRVIVSGIQQLRPGLEVEATEAAP